MAKIHVGRKIKEVLKESKMKSKDFALAINTSRTNIYDIFKRETVDSSLLKEISKVLKFNFFDLYENQLGMVKEEGKKGYVNKKDLIETQSSEIKELKKIILEDKNKIKNLEKINKLQEEKLKRLEKKAKK